MSVESSKTRSRYQEDLADLQADYSRKKKKVNQQNEEEIEGTQENHQKKKQALNTQNEAAINHIQKKQQDTMAKYSESRTRASEKGREKLEKMQGTYAARIEEMQLDRSDAINKINTEKKEKLREITDYTQGKINDAREEGKRELQNIKTHFRSESRAENEKSAYKLEETRERNDQQIESEKMRGERSQEKVRVSYENQIKKLHQDGDAQAQFEKNLADQKLQKVDDEFKKEYDKTYQSWTQREKSLQDSYAQKLEQQKEGHQELLQGQNRHFEKVYDKNEGDNKISLGIQDGRYTKQMLNQKRKFLREANKYSGKEEDPFYKIEDRGSQIRETPSSYILKAYSPEHEKDIVRVTVDRSKAVITGQRKFNDKMEDETKKVTTDSYQSFREEFKFDIPVATEAMVRERQGDFVVFEIPKMSAVDSSTIRFSKKV